MVHDNPILNRIRGLLTGLNDKQPMKSLIVIMALILAASSVHADEINVCNMPWAQPSAAPSDHHSRDRNRKIVAAVAVVAIGVTVSIKLGHAHNNASRVKVSAFAKK